MKKKQDLEIEPLSRVHEFKPDCVLITSLIERDQKSGRLSEILGSNLFEGLEFIESESACRLTEPGDLKDLKEALYELIKFPEKRADMGQKGPKIARQKFSWDSRASKIEKILKELA